MDYEINEAAKITADFVNSTDQHVFLTGKAGTGKTTFLKHLRENSHKKIVVAAPTGIAAINANGVTLHSLLQLPFGAFIPERIPPPMGSGQFNTLYNLFSGIRFNRSKRQLIQEMELLIIDEVSMLRADLLDCIDHMLRFLRRRRDQTFGGAQILFIGDLLQLPPVVKDQEWEILKSHYPSSYFFDAKALSNTSLVHIELEKIYRQSDDRFISILNNFRENKQTADDIAQLNEHYQPNIDEEKLDGYIHLTTHNKKADLINQSRLEALKGSSRSYAAEISGEFPENGFPVPEKLSLKEGAQVMFIKNDPSGEGQFFNGKIGSVTALTSDHIKVMFDDGQEVDVPEYSWENKRFTLNKDSKEIEEKVLGSFKHYPIKLAWAVTIHKSQGLTFDKAILDLSGAFTHGQVYVALSRLTSLSGLILSSKIPEEGFDISSSMKSFIDKKPALKKLEGRLKNDRLTYLSVMIKRHFDFNELATQLKAHLSSFDKQENRSLKQKYLEWSKEMAQPMIDLVPVGKNFQNQSEQIIFKEGDIKRLAVRVEKAKNYFGQLLKATYEEISLQEKKLKGKTQLKTFRNELKELNELIFTQLLSLYRTSVYIEFAAAEKVPTRADIQHVLQELIIPKTKKDKTPTHEVSFKLFKEGKTIDEIAEERGLVPSTIEGHLCKYISSGEIEASELMDEKKLKNILSLITPERMKASELISQLGDEYSYGEVRIALEEWRRLKSRRTDS